MRKIRTNRIGWGEERTPTVHDGRGYVGVPSPQLTNYTRDSAGRVSSVSKRSPEGGKRIPGLDK